MEEQELAKWLQGSAATALAIVGFALSFALSGAGAMTLGVVALLTGITMTIVLMSVRINWWIFAVLYALSFMAPLGVLALIRLPGSV